MSTNLPIDEVLDELLEKLAVHHRCILQAEPGAGKTTRVPLALLQQQWMVGQKIILLEPRRIAARNAAEYMASQLGEKAGQRVGYRMRQDTKVSQQTLIEVVTEGVFVRMLQDDPTLDGVGLVIFDEFHERSLDSDLSLALCLQAAELFREEHPLKLLVMSATLDLPRLQDILACPVVSSAGRGFPVDIIYSEKSARREDIQAEMISTIKRALINNEGSILAFLPGQFDIDKVANELRECFHNQSNIDVCPLYGMMPLTDQRRAIAPSQPGVRKIVLATNIAESSLTIDGVNIVVDSGWTRQSSFDPRTGMSRLQTVRVSQAASVQRAGRAGRLAPGVCYRLWSTQQQQQLNPHDSAEIMQADLLPVVVQLLQWGVSDPHELMWMSPPPKAAYDSAVQLLQSMGMLHINNGILSLTAAGIGVAKLPLHPRLGNILLHAGSDNIDRASLLVALLEERDPLRQVEVDLTLRLSWLEKNRQGSAKRIFLRAQYLKSLVPSLLDVEGGEKNIAELLALGFPDRIAQRRGSQSLEYKLANGRGVTLPEGDRLQTYEYLVVADLGGQVGQSQDRIYLAAGLLTSAFQSSLKELLEEHALAEWDTSAEKMLFEKQCRCGQLVIERKPLNNITPDQVLAGMLAFIRKRGLDILPWQAQERNFIARLNTAKQYCSDVTTWPNVDEKSLLATLEDWLAPFMVGVQSLKQLQKIDLLKALQNLLDWPSQQSLANCCPEAVLVPTGRMINIDYSGERPVLAVKMQEMFGCPTSPVIAMGRLPLTLHLLSPAQRPLAVTADLASFWKNAYLDVKKDMKGRYPKHYWPDDPLQAMPTKFVKSRM